MSLRPELVSRRSGYYTAIDLTLSGSEKMVALEQRYDRQVRSELK